MFSFSRQLRTQRHLVFLLGIQIVTIVAVIFIFRWIQPKMVASLIAGGSFVVMGLILLTRILSWIDFQKRPIFWMTGLHLGGVSIPMVFQRISHWGEDFAQIRVWGISGPAFHGFANVVSLGLLLVTCFEFAILKYEHKEGAR